MQDVSAPALPWLTIDEAARLIAGSDSNLSQREVVVEQLRQAVEAGDLHAMRIVRWENGRINQMATTVQHTALADWCQKNDIPLPGGTTAQAGDEAGDEATAGTTAATAANTSAAGQTAQPASGKRIRHRPAHPLTAVIEMARKTVSDGGGDENDYLLVWLVLVEKMAKIPNRPTPLVGYAEGDVKYSAKTKHDTDVVKCFSKGALRKWMEREALRQLREREVDAGGR